MTKLIIQIPAYNESETLGIALDALPKKITGIDVIETLIIDDGSADDTVAVAKKHNVTHIVSHVGNKGLAKAFMTGIQACLEQGADIIVNTDADNQYNADDIQHLVKPILAKQADIVIGDRPISKTDHFSIVKKMLQYLGSFVVRKVSKTTIQDAPSGFRAISREGALKLNVFNPYTYTVEMIIQAGRQGISICSVPIRTNEDLRPSRLVKSIPTYVKNMILTMIRVLNTYRPLQVFMIVGSIPTLIGLGLGIRWILLFMGQGQAQSLPSLILTAILIILGVQLWIFGLIADLISVNRKLLEDIQYQTRKHLNK